MTSTNTSGAELATPTPHGAEKPNKNGLILGLMFLGWVVALAVAFAIFGLGGFITVATITSWGILALFMVMTAGG